MVKNNDTMKKPCQLTGKTASNKMAASNSHIIILLLNVNGLNAPIKRNRLANWIKKSRPNGLLYSRNPSHIQTHIDSK